MLRKSREYDCQILQERMELLQQAHQVRTEPLHLCRVGTKQMGLSTKYVVWSVGERSPGAVRHLRRVRYRTLVGQLDSETGWQFGNDSVLRKLAFQKHCLLLLFGELFCHEIPFGSPGAWLAPLCREARLSPGQKYCFLLLLIPVHNLAWSDHLNRVKENKGLFLYSQNKQQQQQSLEAAAYLLVFAMSGTKLRALLTSLHLIFTVAH